jgi:zinc transporter ZupT
LACKSSFKSKKALNDIDLDPVGLLGLYRPEPVAGLCRRPSYSHQSAVLDGGFSAGTMLSAALMDVLPEALEQEGVDPHLLFGVLLLALLCFYFMERAALWRHHHHSPDAAQDLADTAVPHHHADLKPARYAALLGDGVHNFVDGLLIAAAFMADPWLGVTTAAAIFVHELPQEIGVFGLRVDQNPGLDDEPVGRHDQSAGRLGGVVAA